MDKTPPEGTSYGLILFGVIAAILLLSPVLMLVAAVLIRPLVAGP